jgi:hypothetical protein
MLKPVFSFGFSGDKSRYVGEGVTVSSTLSDLRKVTQQWL